MTFDIIYYTSLIQTALKFWKKCFKFQQDIQSIPTNVSKIVIYISTHAWYLYLLMIGYVYFCIAYYLYCFVLPQSVSNIYQHYQHFWSKMKDVEIVDHIVFYQYVKQTNCVIAVEKLTLWRLLWQYLCSHICS